jgi:hypothetical protein
LKKGTELRKFPFTKLLLWISFVQRVSKRRRRLNRISTSHFSGRKTFKDPQRDAQSIPFLCPSTDSLSSLTHPPPLPPSVSCRGLQGDVVYLVWPIAPLVLWAQMRGEGAVAGSQPIGTAVHITWHGAQINFGDPTPYLTYGQLIIHSFSLIVLVTPWDASASTFLYGIG